MAKNSWKLADRRMIRLCTKACGLVLLLAVAAGSAWAGSDERKGTSGASELLIQVGPRGTALGSSVASDVQGVEATFWNPAGLATLEGTQAMFSHTQYIADMKVNYAAVAARAGALGVLGFSAKVLSIGDVIVTTEQAPDGTGEIVDPTFTVLGVSWAREFTDRVNFGVTANYVNEQLLSMSASGLAFDFGVQYRTGWRGLGFSMTMKNFGPPMEFDGENLEVNILPPGSNPSAGNRTVRFTTSSFEMPSQFSLAASYDLYNQRQQRLQARGAFQNNNFEFDNLIGSVEWSYRNLYALRASYFGSFGTSIGPDGNESGVEFDRGNDLYSGFALGGGASFRTGDVGRIGVDVSWRPVREFFDDVVEFGIRYSF